MKRALTLSLGEFALAALAGEGDRGSRRIAGRMARAISTYLHDADSGRPGWPYPRFLSEMDGAETRELDISIDEGLWSQFEAEAARQGVSARQLAEHAALYYAAELEAGRITERILGDLENSED
jgi:hypothetical protein